jgi:hypothetical protein
MKVFIQDLLADKPNGFFNKNILYVDGQAIMVAST